MDQLIIRLWQSENPRRLIPARSTPVIDKAMDQLLSLLQLPGPAHAPGRDEPAADAAHERHGAAAWPWGPGASEKKGKDGARRVRFDSACKGCKSPRGGPPDFAQIQARIDARIASAKAQALRAQAGVGSVGAGRRVLVT